jgi:hypothetical protein
MVDNPENVFVLYCAVYKVCVVSYWLPYSQVTTISYCDVQDFRILYNFFKTVHTAVGNVSLLVNSTARMLPHLMTSRSGKCSRFGDWPQDHKRHTLLVYLYCVFPCYDTVESGRFLPAFWKNMAILFMVREFLCPSETMVHIDKIARC